MPTSLYIFIAAQCILDFILFHAIGKLISQDLKLLDLIELSHKVSSTASNLPKMGKDLQKMLGEILTSKTPKK